MESFPRIWRREPDDRERDELRKTEMALRQLERAELYVLSAIDLDLADWGLRRRLHDLRCEVIAVCDELRRPRQLR
jgi:hypothetical protein